MPEIGVKVREKIAQPVGAPEIVCGNSDYVIELDTDNEWTGYESKTARFVWCDLRTGKIMHSDVLFTGNKVNVPALYDTAAVAVGLYAGDIHTTTPARIPCARCITDGTPQHEDPPPDVYDQLLAYLEELSKGCASTPEKIRRPVKMQKTEPYIETFVLPRAMLTEPLNDEPEAEEDMR